MVQSFECFIILLIVDIKTPMQCNMATDKNRIAFKAFLKKNKPGKRFRKQLKHYEQFVFSPIGGCRIKKFEEGRVKRILSTVKTIRNKVAFALGDKDVGFEEIFDGRFLLLYFDRLHNQGNTLKIYASTLLKMCIEFKENSLTIRYGNEQLESLANINR